MEIKKPITRRKSENIRHPKNIDNIDLVLLSCLILLILSSFSIYYSPHTHDVNAQQQEMTTAPTVTSQTPPSQILPKSLSVTDNKMGDTQLPLRASIINEKYDGNLMDLKAGQGEGKLSEFFPIVAFRLDTQPTGFEERAPIVENVLIGPIKSYDSRDDILEEANYWKDIPLGERVALEIDHPGKHYFIASVEFENGTSGIYSGVMDVNALGIKPSPNDSIQFQLDSADISSGVVIINQADMTASEADPVFQQLVYRIICSDLSENGFEVCGTEEEESVAEEDDGNKNNDGNKDDGEEDGDSDDVEVRGDGGKGGIYDVNNCTGEQCEDADKETEEEKESDDCEIDPDLCKDSDGDGDDSSDSDEENKDTEEEEEPENENTADA
ncbi:MAG: hypothetical protein WBW34_00070 [Nitrososphaeraceae archaeon]